MRSVDDIAIGDTEYVVLETGPLAPGQPAALMLSALPEPTLLERANTTVRSDGFRRGVLPAAVGLVLVVLVGVILLRRRRSSAHGPMVVYTYGEKPPRQRTPTSWRPSRVSTPDSRQVSSTRRTTTSGGELGWLRWRGRRDDYGRRPPQSNRQRLILMAVVAVPLIAFFTVLGIALTRSGGVPAGVAINSTFGEADVDVTAARDFTLTTFDGDVLRLSDLRGSYVMVDFWSSWCPPCREEAPVLAAAYDRYRTQGVEFVGVAVWDVDTGGRPLHRGERRNLPRRRRHPRRHRRRLRPNRHPGKVLHRPPRPHSPQIRRPHEPRNPRPRPARAAGIAVTTEYCSPPGAPPPVAAGPAPGRQGPASR